MKVKIIEKDGKIYLVDGYCTAEYSSLKDAKAALMQYNAGIEAGMNEHEASADAEINWVY